MSNPSGDKVVGWLMNLTPRWQCTRRVSGWLEPGIVSYE